MENNTSFACAINCMDGRTQDAVKNYLATQHGVTFVDMVTEPGPSKILAESESLPIVENIRKRVGISVGHHGAKAVAIVAHHACAGNPVSKEQQIEHLKKAKETVEAFGFGVEVILLWVPDGWKEAELIR